MGDTLNKNPHCLVERAVQGAAMRRNVSKEGKRICARKKKKEKRVREIEGKRREEE